MKIPIAIHGAAGRMGQRLIVLGQADPAIQLTAALESSNHPRIGQDIGAIAGLGTIGLPLTDQLPSNVGAIIDFSVPYAVDAIINQAAERQIPLVVATTGLEEPTIAKLRHASQSIPIVWAPSMSLAVNVALRLCAAAAEALRSVESGVDVEIVETHHRFKTDAPSGTALKFGQIITNIMGQTSARHGRHGQVGARPVQEIGYHAVRSGDNPGEHRISFGMLGESLELTVKASSRDCYATGALAAAKFVVRKEPGLYSMDDVIWPGSGA